MNIEEIRQYVLQKKEVTESFPFGPDTLVFKVYNKIFLLMGLDNTDLSFNVKCDPDVAIELREAYPHNVLPGYHMNKKHWNTVKVAGLKSPFLRRMIEESYNLVAKRKKSLTDEK